MHIKVETKRFDATPTEWLSIAGQAGELANKWSSRGDIIAYVGKGAGMGIAAALWNPQLAEMEIAVDQAFGEGAKPEFIGDLTDREIQFEQPVACGAILHEAMHARHTRFDFSKVRLYKDKRVGSLVEWFEETRIESRGVLHWPKNRSFLRASALKLAVADMHEAAKDAETAHVMHLSKLILLTLARVTAGVLDPDDVKPMRDTCEKVLGTDLLDKLEKIWTKAQAHSDDEDWRPLKKLAEDWVKALEDAGHKTQPSKEEREAARQIAEALREMLGSAPGDEEGDPTEGGGGGGMLDEAADETEARARGEAMDQGGVEQAEEEAKEAPARSKEDDAAAQEAGRIFAKGTGDLVGVDTRSKLIRERDPSDDERAAAVTVARMLERARYRDRIVTVRSSVMPPGRLRSRTAVQVAAEEARGSIQTAAPWRSKQRHHVEDPQLKVGFMTDISGSMGSVMEPMAVANWVFSEAVRRVQGTIASVYYGNSVFPGLAPGEHLRKVKVYSAPDGTERFDSAFKAINGRVGLLNNTGARLLVVVSDLHYTQHERSAARKWFRRCQEDGVAVIVIPFDAATYYAPDVVKDLPGVKLLDGVDSPVKAALEIGHACAEALTTVGGNRG